VWEANVPNATDNADAPRVRDGSCKLWAGGNIHAREHDGVSDLEQIGRDRPQLLCA
jgi:hypothetical protein